MRYDSCAVTPRQSLADLPVITISLWSANDCRGVTAQLSYRIALAFYCSPNSVLRFTRKLSTGIITAWARCHDNLGLNQPTCFDSSVWEYPPQRPGAPDWSIIPSIGCSSPNSSVIG